MIDRRLLQFYFSIASLGARVFASQEAVLEVSKGIPLTSKFAQNILSEARSLENVDGQDISWLPKYAIKVTGCNNMMSWNEEAGGEDDVRFSSHRLLKFRLCPEDSCNHDSKQGCSSSPYGDYIVKLDTFMENYVDWLNYDNYLRCVDYAEQNCHCAWDDDNNANYDKDQCMFQCWFKNGQDECYIDYTYGDDDANDDGTFAIAKYLTCNQYYDGGGRRKLNNDDDTSTSSFQFDDDYTKRVNYYKNYYIGPYCASDSNRVYLGMFTDDTCTLFADERKGRYTFMKLTGGQDLPYSKYSDPELVSSKCITCESMENQYMASDLCYMSYFGAGKCETNLGTEINYPNEQACSYIYSIENQVQDSEKQKQTLYMKYSEMFWGYFDIYTNNFLLVTGALFVGLAVYASFLKCCKYSNLSSVRYSFSYSVTDMIYFLYEQGFLPRWSKLEKNKLDCEISITPSVKWRVIILT